MPRYRVTRRDNPSDRLEDDFDDLAVSGGAWVFIRNVSAPVAAQSFGGLAVRTHTVEIAEHGGAWREVDPETLEPAPS